MLHRSPRRNRICSEPSRFTILRAINIFSQYVMSAFDRHLEQISLSATAIAELPYVSLGWPCRLTHLLTYFPNSFQRPKAFTNALLQPHDITSLIRDTESHERALFSVKPAGSSRARSRSRSRSINPRRATLLTEDINNPSTGSNDPNHPNFQDSSMVSRIYAATSNQRHSAVAHVLGNDMMGEIKRSTAAAAAATSGSSMARAKGEVNIELLLRGAKMLCEA